MAIDAVPGYGEINASNAKEIYKAYRKGEVDLSPSQRKYTESFLTKEDYDEIEYDTDIAQKDGRDQIGDAEKADEHGGQGGNATATSAGMAAGAIGFAVLAKKANFANTASGFAALGFGAATAACAAATLIFAKMFDNGYDDRCGAKDNADGTNETIDANTAVLEDSMEAMNDDMELYQEQSDLYTETVNTNTSDVASLEIQLQEALAAGDADGAAQLQEQIKQLKGRDFGGMEEDMEETKSHIDEYINARDEATGVSDAGQTVSDFLKEGTPLGVVAALDAAMLAVATTLSTTAIYSAIKKGIECTGSGPWRWAEAACAYAGAALYVVSVALGGIATTAMATKAKGEFECGSAGGDMQGHVDELNSMIGEQEAYVDTTNESFGATDDEAGENQDKATEAAGKATSQKSDDMKKVKTGSSTGGGEGGQAA